FCGIAFDPVIQGQDFLRWPFLGLRLEIIANRCQRRENYLNVVSTGKFDHGSVVVLDCIGWNRTGASTDIIRSRKNDHYFGMYCDHVLIEPEQHLRRDLPT